MGHALRQPFDQERRRCALCERLQAHRLLPALSAVLRDDDGDGQAELAEELCRSASETAFESCRLGDPDGGTYWIRVQNWLTGGTVLDEVDPVAAVVPGTSAGNLTATGPKSVPANTAFDVAVMRLVSIPGSRFEK